MYVGEKVTGTTHTLVKDTNIYVQTVLEEIKNIIPYVNNESKRGKKDYNSMTCSIVQNGATVIDKDGIHKSL